MPFQLTSTSSLLICIIIFASAFSCTSSSSKNSDDTIPEISISTTSAVPLNKHIHSACSVDIFYTKGMTPRNILSDPYFSFIKDLNFSSLQYSGGSTADYDHVIIGDALVSGGRGDGYNMLRTDAQKRNEPFETLLDGVGTVKFGIDFFNEYCALLNKLKIPGDVIANVQSGSLQELYWKIKQANAGRVIFGMEQSLQSNDFDFPDGNAYKKKITPWTDSVKKKFPGVITVIDAAPVWKTQQQSQKWNEQISSMPGDEARLYLWDKDLFATTNNTSGNLAAIDKVFSETIPFWLNDFSKTFPGKKVAVCQWGLKPKSNIYNTMLSVLYIGRMYQFMIDYNKAHQDFIDYASFMSLKSLDRGDDKGKDATNHYLALKLCGMLFNEEKKADDLVISGVNGVRGVAVEGKEKYTLLLINETGHEVQFSSVKVNGKVLQSKTFNIVSLSAPSLDSYEVKEETSVADVIKLLPYSLNLINM